MLRSSLNICPLGRAAILSLVLLPVRSVAVEEAQPIDRPEAVRARWLMGTVLELRLPAALKRIDELAEAAFAEVAKVESAASLWRPGTELGAVHIRANAGEAVVLSGTLGDLVQEALRAAEVTSGAYSPAVGALVSAYDLRGGGRWPSWAERRRAVELARREGVHYDPRTRVLRLDEGVSLDFDGIAKGFALDRAAAALRVRGVDDALLNFGGQLYVIGPPPGAPAREALVASPFDSGTPLLTVRVRDASLSTSANSERARMIDGKEAGHLLDPRTGRFVTLPGSVTILAASGALADALSTAWAVEGPAAFRRSDPGSRLRRAGAVAFAMAGREGGHETLSDRPFERLRPPARVVDAAIQRP